MNRIFGIKDNFYFMQLFDLEDSMSDFYDQFKKYFLGKYAAITAFDSGMLIISGNDESEKGWMNLNNIAYSPKLTNETYMPSAGFDEWYFFDEINRNFKPSEIFANYSTILISDSDLSSQQRIAYDLFWSEMNNHSPYAYLSEGGTLIFATKDKELMKQVEKHYL